MPFITSYLIVQLERQYREGIILIEEGNYKTDSNYITIIKAPICYRSVFFHYLCINEIHYYHDRPKPYPR